MDFVTLISFSTAKVPEKADFFGEFDHAWSVACKAAGVPAASSDFVDSRPEPREWERPNVSP